MNLKNGKLVGALVGDIVGSVYEFDNRRTKTFEMFGDWHGRKCFATDDSIMTLAIAKAVMDSAPDHHDLGQNAIRAMREVGQPYPHCGYGGRFLHWMYCDDPQPYNSYGNGAAMRVSPVAYFAADRNDAMEMAKIVTEVTHNHPEGIKGAQTVAGLVYMALNGSTMDAMKKFAMSKYPELGFALDQIRSTYQFNETCQQTVPQAITAFFESQDFEDAIRNAISVGGDSDTLACITGSIAGAYYGVSDSIRNRALSYLDNRLLTLYNDFTAVSAE